MHRDRIISLGKEVKNFLLCSCSILLNQLCLLRLYVLRIRFTDARNGHDHVSSMMPMTIEELLTYIFQGSSHTLAAQFALWVTASARFRAIAERDRDKIRKKVRGTRDE